MLTAERTSDGGITAFRIEDGKRSASLTVSADGALRVRIAGPGRRQRAALVATATGLHGKTLSWANVELYMLLGDAEQLDAPLATVLTSEGEFYVLPGKVAAPAMKSDKPDRVPRTVTTYFQDYVAKSVTHPQGELDSNVPAFTSSLTDARSGERVGALRWFRFHEMLQWKIDGKPSTVLANELPERWTFTPTPEWANVQLYSLARARENHAASASRTPTALRPFDTEGCDGLHWLDETIFKACCDKHDACYAKEEPACGYRSWWLNGSWSCVKCNIGVLLCFATLGSTAGNYLGPLVQDWNVPESDGCGGGVWCPAYCSSCG